MHRLIDWIKNNKLTTLLLLVVVYFIFKPSGSYLVNTDTVNSIAPSLGIMGSAGTFSQSAKSVPVTGGSYGEMRPINQPAPAIDVTSRMVQKTASQSLLVKDVPATVNQVENYASKAGGYVVTSNLSEPEAGDTAQVTLRVPSDKLKEALDVFRTYSVRVVSQNTSGNDVTDQFVDNDARLKILQSNKARFEEIMNSAKTTAEILQVQQEIFNLQSQIESIQGQQKYLAATSTTSLINLYISTDELALPYAPTEIWRPEVIFRTAVRSLLGSLEQLGSALIWIAVYAVVWIPLGLILLFVYKRFLAPTKK